MNDDVSYDKQRAETYRNVMESERQMVLDAERYRFLRDHCAKRSLPDDNEFLMWQMSTPWRRGKTVDEAIDDLIRTRK